MEVIVLGVCDYGTILSTLHKCNNSNLVRPLEGVDRPLCRLTRLAVHILPLGLLPVTLLLPTQLVLVSAVLGEVVVGFHIYPVWFGFISVASAGGRIEVGSLLK